MNRLTSFVFGVLCLLMAYAQLILFVEAAVVSTFIGIVTLFSMVIAMFGFFAIGIWLLVSAFSD